MRDHTPAFIMRRDSSASGRERQQQRECRWRDKPEVSAQPAAGNTASMRRLDDLKRNTAFYFGFGQGSERMRAARQDEPTWLTVTVSVVPIILVTFGLARVLGLRTDSSASPPSSVCSWLPPSCGDSCSGSSAAGQACAHPRANARCHARLGRQSEEAAAERSRLVRRQKRVGSRPLLVLIFDPRAGRRGSVK